MRLVIQENADLVTDWAARYVLKRVKDFNPGPDNFFVLGLPTGNLYIYIQLFFLFLISLFSLNARTAFTTRLQLNYCLITKMIISFKQLECVEQWPSCFEDVY